MSRHITTRSSTRSLRSSSGPFLQVPFRRTSFGKRSFSTAAPSVWNSLPTSVLNCDSLTLDLKLIFSLLFLANWLNLYSSASEAIAPRRSTNRDLGRVALVRGVAAYSHKLSRGRSVGLSIGRCVGLSSALWKTVDRIRMPFGIIGRTGPGMRHGVGLGIGPRVGNEFEARHCNQWGLIFAATRPSSQITLNSLFYNDVENN